MKIMDDELKRKRIYFYSSWRQLILSLDGKETMNESKNFLLNLCNHCENLTIKLGSEREELIWNGVLPLLEFNKEKYDARVKTSKENGKLGGRPSKNLNNLKKPTKPDTGKDTGTGTGTGTEKEKEKEVSDGASTRPSIGPSIGPNEDPSEDPGEIDPKVESFVGRDSSPISECPSRPNGIPSQDAINQEYPKEFDEAFNECTVGMETRVVRYMTAEEKECYFNLKPIDQDPFLRAWQYNNSWIINGNIF